MDRESIYWSLRVNPRPVRRAGRARLIWRFGLPRSPMLYMIIERFRDGDPVPVYRRFRDRGRSMPEGLRYVSSWVTNDLSRCYQVMETERPELLDEWIAAW